MKKGTHPSCPLTKLIYVELSGPLPGIKFIKNECHLETELFPCCKGTGLNFDYASGFAKHCDLNARLVRVRNLFENFHRHWPNSPIFPPLSSEIENKLKKWLLNMAQDKENKGYCLKRSERTPSFLWTFAAMAIWRYNFEILWINLGRTPLNTILNEIGQIESNGICIIEQNEPLWKYQHDLECIIGWCENAGLPVWLDFLVQNENKLSFSANSSQSEAFLHFQKRLNSIKSAPPLSWVDQFCRSRLKTVCHNSEAFIGK